MASILSTVLLAFCGWVLWELVSFIRTHLVTAHLRRIRGPQATSLWTGNLKEFYSRDAGGYQRHLSRQYGSVIKLNGFLGTPVLYISDPKALHTILIKEEHIFYESEEFIATTGLVFGSHSLLSTLGAEHSRQRKLLNPVFSVNHMRHMTPLFYNITYRLRDAIMSRVNQGQHEIDMLGWMGRTALELIGQGGLGYSFDPLVEDRPDVYGDSLKSLLPSLRGLVLFERLNVVGPKVLPARVRRALVEMFPKGTLVHRVKEIVDTMDSRSREIFNGKKAAIAKGDAEVVKQVAEGKDLISILMRANSLADAADRLSEEEVIHQMSVLIFAAMDTTSNTLSRILQLLAEHPDTQEKLRQELLHAGAADGLSYDELNRLPLLDSICHETLRVYPPVTILARRATKDTVLPLCAPIYDANGTQMDEIAVPKGSKLLVDFFGCNTSKTLWGEDAYEWKPERWMSPLPAAVTDAHIPGVYSNLLTFGGGKRACIGFKFSEMEMKVVLSVLVTAFTFDMPAKTIEWNVAPVWYPSLKEDRAKPQMPLDVKAYKSTRV
ncbi:cytochrome P450 [Fomitopsis betulina]|nr:cytochrome P450 [Fomitopsis betulina]